MSDVAVVNISATYNFQEEKTHASSRVRRGNSAELSPKIWWIFGKASNPQTPNGALQENERTSGPLTIADEVSENTASIYRQLPACDWNWSRRGQDGVQQRINFTSRYQGNKASCYETLGQRPSVRRKQRKLQAIRPQSAELRAYTRNSQKPPKFSELCNYLYAYPLESRYSCLLPDLLGRV